MSRFIDGYDEWKLSYPPEWDEDPSRDEEDEEEEEDEDE